MKTAKWIWCAGQDVKGYNLAARFRKKFVAEAAAHAVLRITADSRYRVSLNGGWINDGPGKAYPEHYTYDTYDMAALLKPGRNTLEITVRYYGIGTFHQIPQQAGLLAELELDGRVIGTDATWEAAPVEWLRRWVPKVSCQMEPCESVDGRLADRMEWKPAVVLCAADAGPWKDLAPRRSKPLTKVHCKPQAVHGIRAVARAPQRVCVPVTRLAHPGVIETNNYTSRPVILASVMTLDKPRQLDFTSADWRVSIEGKRVDGKASLGTGRHTVLFLCVNFYGHIKELPFPFLHLCGVQWGEWSVFVKEECLFRDNDMVWFCFENKASARVKQEWMEWVEKTAGAWAGVASNVPDLGRRIGLPEDQIFIEDYTGDFAARSVVCSAEDRVGNPVAVCAGGKGAVRVEPVADGDVEICYDLGEQCCGYFDIELAAGAGVVADLHLVEYITPEGVVQHTAEHNRNGMRYVTRDGINRYTSLKRRSGRYLFLTLRHLTAPVEIRRLEMIESTANVKPVERFRCGDENLNRVWEACERTLKMGMDDTFTDCSLYEQTLWIGDARNQALYAFNVYGGHEVSARSLEIGAQSLERFPIVGCQVPSTWECLLPAWSFLWGMHVWEHYFYSGDRGFLERIWPAVMKNLRGASGFLDRMGLFSGTLWNLLEWAPIDDAHPTVTHNSLLFIAALRAAENCAGVLGDGAAREWLHQRREESTGAVNAIWDPVKKSYPDAILEDGTPSPKTCQHNSALAILAGVLPPERMADARANLLHPPGDMTRIGSPFAAQFHFEALEMLGEYDAILASIRENYLPMIAAGATTVWETFPNSTCSPKGFPTRSHCHGWSCGPLQFFNRIILGIRPTAPGGTAFEISPWITGLEYAAGAMATPRGPVHVEWRVGGGDVHLNVRAPDGVKITMQPNTSLEGKKLHFWQGQVDR